MNDVVVAIIGITQYFNTLAKMKKIAIFGGTGMTGLCTVEAALKQGKLIGVESYGMIVSI